MVVFSLLVINKAGGLIYYKEFHQGLNQLSTNDLLILAGTFHGVHAITTRLNPLPDGHPDKPRRPTGLEVLETDAFRLQCFQTHTGLKFLLFTEPQQPNVEAILTRVYELYADYVMKNPFYQLEMPIRCEKFDKELMSYIRPK